MKKYKKQTNKQCGIITLQCDFECELRQYVFHVSRDVKMRRQLVISLATLRFSPAKMTANNSNQEKKWGKMPLVPATLHHSPVTSNLFNNPCVSIWK